MNWHLDLAPWGVIEFEPKTDSMVQQLLQFREEKIPHYSENMFVDCIVKGAETVRTEVIPKTRRMLIEYKPLALT